MSLWAAFMVGFVILFLIEMRPEESLILTAVVSLVLVYAWMGYVILAQDNGSTLQDMCVMAGYAVGVITSGAAAIVVIPDYSG